MCPYLLSQRKKIIEILKEKSGCMFAEPELFKAADEVVRMIVEPLYTELTKEIEYSSHCRDRINVLMDGVSQLLDVTAQTLKTVQKQINNEADNT
jgi:hypothetical protein